MSAPAERHPAPTAPRLGLASQISRVAFAFAAVFALVVGVTSWSVTREVLLERELGALGLEASLQSRELEQPLHELAHGLEALAASNFVTNALVDSVGRERYVVPYLREYRAGWSVAARVSLCDHLGRELAANEPGGGRSHAGAPWLPRVLEGGAKVVALSEAPDPRLLLAMPVIFPHTGRAEGLLVADLDLRALFAATRPAADTGAIRRLLDRAGRALAEDGGAPEDPIATRWPLSSGPVGELGLQLELQVPRERIRAPLRRLGLAYGVAGLLLAATALFAARLLSGRVARPLRDLHAAAREAATRASFDVRVPAEGSAEVAELGATLNEMLARLHAATEARYATEEGRRTRAEGALELAHAALEQASEPIEILRPDGTVLFANRAVARLLRTTPEAMRDQPIWLLAPGQISEERWGAVWEAVRRDGHRELQVEDRRDGAPAHFEIRLHHLSFAGAEYGLVTVRDVSDRARAEQAGRLASLGTMAAGVAHEINNPMAYVTANLAWVRKELGPKGAEVALSAEDADDLREALTEASQGAVRVQDVVRSLRVFSRPSAPRRISSDVEEELRSALQLTANELRHRARLVVKIAPLRPVLAGEHELGQVFTNLIMNAAQAIAPGRAEENLVEVSARMTGPGHVVVEISDTGSGIAPEHLPRIFEPFFTTKQAGSGTGLGLSVCEGIVSRTGGRIEVDSKVGRGTLFRVTLPAERAELAPAERIPTPVPGRSLRVVVVDDEPAIGRAVARALRGQHDLTETTSPRQVLAMLDEGRTFDVLLCDLQMPEMTGMELHRRLVLRHPELASRTVIVTGGAFTPEARAFVEEAGLPVLEKPFTTDGLLAALAQASERSVAA